MNKLLKSVSSKIPLIIIIIDGFVPLIVWPYGHDYFYYPKIIVIYFLISIILITETIAWKNKKNDLDCPKEFFPLVIYFCCIIISTFFSKYTWQSIWGAPLRWEGLFTYICYFLIYYFSYSHMNSYKNIKKTIDVLLVSASIISVYSILQFIGFDPIPRDNIRSSWYYMSFATLGNPNFLGSYLSIILPISLWMYIITQRKKKVYALFATTCLLFTATVCSMTRSAWIAIGASIIGMLILFKGTIISRLKRLVVLLLTCAIIVTGVNSVHRGMLKNKFNSLVKDIEIIVKDTPDKSRVGSQRIFIWYRTIDHIFERPFFGSGPDTFDKVFKMSPEEATRYFGASNIYVDKAHNEYLQILITTGFPALISYLFFLLIIALNSFKKISGSNPHSISIPLAFGVLAYVIQAFFNISVVSVAPLYWSVLGMLSRANTIKQKGLP